MKVADKQHCKPLIMFDKFLEEFVNLQQFRHCDFPLETELCCTYEFGPAIQVSDIKCRDNLYQIPRLNCKLHAWLTVLEGDFVEVVMKKKLPNWTNLQP